jgi:hypothetical protein
MRTGKLKRIGLLLALAAPLALLFLLPALSVTNRPREEQAITAADEYKALTDEYVKTQREADQAFEKARTAQERQKIRADFRKLRNHFIGRFLVFAEKHSKDQEALKALFFVFHPDIQAEGRDADKAAQLMLQDHLKSDRIGFIIECLGAQDSPAAERVLREVLQKNPSHAIQAHACLGLAQILKERANASPPAQTAKLIKEAEQWFERVVDKYADVKVPAEKAKSELFEIRHLAVGKAAPDIKGKDSDDKEFKLSDYRGKIVVLDFWAEW